jgi:FdhD protein
MSVVERVRGLGVLRWSAAGDTAGPAGAQAEDQVVVEEPLEIRIDGVPLLVVMRTPGHDLELAAGLLSAEGIVRTVDDIATLAHCRDGIDPELANVVNVRLSDARRAETEADLARRRAERATVSSASCGVCGKRSIESLESTAPPFARPPRIDPALIQRLPAKMRAAQELFDATGGLHAAAIFDRRGELCVLREDVGRHSAVDKCVGHLLLTERAPIEDAILMVSGRASFEIVQKALVARIPTLAAVSAPSSLAVELARASRMGLLGFVRGAGMNVYAGETS